MGGAIHVDRKDVLQRCAVKFRKDPQYTQDIRYLDICLKYADQCDDAREVFLFLEQQGIGTQLPKLYSAWALVLEHCGQYDEAERVLETGKVNLTDEKAQMLGEFQVRLRERAIEAKQRKATEPDEPVGRGPQRKAFGDVRHTKRGRVATSRAPVSSRGGLGGRGAAPAQSNAGAGGLTIFADPEGAASTGTGGFQVFSDLPSEKVTKKENTQEAGQWTGGIKSTKAKHVAPVGFAVFTDEASAEEPAAPHAPQVSYRQTLERKALGNYKAQEAVSLKDYARDRNPQSRQVCTTHGWQHCCVHPQPKNPQAGSRYSTHNPPRKDPTQTFQ